MPNTPGGLPYPDPTDPVSAGADNIRNLAQALDVVGMWIAAAAQNVQTATFVVVNAATAIPSITNDPSLTNNAGAITIGKAGIYRLSAQLRWSGGGSAGSRRGIHMTLNGATIDGSGNIAAGGRNIGATIAAPGVGGDVTQGYTSPPFKAIAGDIVRVFAFQDSGITLPLVWTATDSNTYQGPTLISIARQ